MCLLLRICLIYILNVLAFGSIKKKNFNSKIRLRFNKKKFNFQKDTVRNDKERLGTIRNG